MQLPKCCVLVLHQQPDEMATLMEFSTEELKCPMVVASSVEQAILRAEQLLPNLIILVGGEPNWPQTLIAQLRSIDAIAQATIVALTENQVWLSSDDHPGLDGLLVRPLHSDVLSSLVHSAWVRQTCCAA
jgi:hypothetical protein